MGAYQKAYMAHVDMTAGKGNTQKWTAEKLLHALHCFVLDKGRLPTWKDQLGPANDMPARATIGKAFAGLHGWLKAYKKYEGPLPEMDMSLARESVPVNDYGDEDAQVEPIHTPEPITRRCNLCGEFWNSPDRRLRWRCEPCTQLRNQSDEDDHDGSWITGELITDKITVDLNEFEPLPTVAEEMARVFGDKKHAKQEVMHG